MLYYVVATLKKEEFNELEISLKMGKRKEFGLICDKLFKHASSLPSHDTAPLPVETKEPIESVSHPLYQRVEPVAIKNKGI